MEILKDAKLLWIMGKKPYSLYNGVFELKIKVLKKDGNELKIEVEGAGHGLCNLLQKKLLEDETVDMAGYDIPHLLVSNPVIYVRMKGSTKPETALKRAVGKAIKANEAFSKELEKALKA